MELAAGESVQCSPGLSINEGGSVMKNNLVRAINSIPVPTPEQGDRAITLACSFIAGFIFAILVFGL